MKMRPGIAHFQKIEYLRNADWMLHVNLLVLTNQIALIHCSLVDIFVLATKD